jgi:NAD(P)H-hydrate epimerase
MRWIVTANEMRSLENHMIKKVGLSSLVLMENAGAAACRILLKKIESLGGRDKFSFVVLCGPGSNGGDGFVVARHLLLAGIEPFVVLVGVQAKQLRGDVATQCKVWKNLGKPLFEVKTAAQLRLLMNHCEKSERHGCLIDGLFGIGLVRPLSGIFAEVVKWVNFHFSNGFKFSLDLPSGMHPDTGGDFDQLAVQADLTVTFANCKRGMFLGAGPYFCGEVVVADIGISDEHSKLLPPSKVRFNSSDFFADFMLPRERDAHKGDHGHLLVVAGSPEKSGAAVLSCRSAMRAGCGLVTLATPASAHSMIKSQLVEVMSCAL